MSNLSVSDCSVNFDYDKKPTVLVPQAGRSSFDISPESQIKSRRLDSRSSESSRKR